MGQPDKETEATIRQWNWLRARFPVLAWSMPVGAIVGLLLGILFAGVSDPLSGAMCAVAGAAAGLVLGVLLQLPVSLITLIVQACRRRDRGTKR